MKRIISTALIAAGLVGALAGCGAMDEANNHNDQAPAYDVRPGWHRIDSPPNYPTIVTACVGADGIYIDQDSANSVMVVPRDPACEHS